MQTCPVVAKNMTVALGDSKTKRVLLVVNRASGTAAKGISKRERLSTHIDLDDPYTCFSVEEKSRQVWYEPERTINQMQGDESEDQYCTTCSSTAPYDNVSKNKSMRGIVAAMVINENSETSRNSTFSDMEP